MTGAIYPHLLAAAPWLIRPETQAVFAALTAEGGLARAVGGAVRNTLLGYPASDVDMATPLRPDIVVRLARKAGLSAIPTGLKHGTITVICRHVPFEVTTLRRDIETFGRHAEVAFTDDWTEDAGRRDFTMNALYCDADGTVYDPLQGHADVLARRVRFIGDAAQRLREDYLRILRFFRFGATYGNGTFDAEGLAACQSERHGLTRISGERIRAEFLRLLAAPHALAAVTAMESCGVLGTIFARWSLPVLERLARIEETVSATPDPVLRLAALTVADAKDASAVRSRLRLSNAEAGRLRATASTDPGVRLEPDPVTSETAAHVVLYRHGVAAFRDAVLIAWARSDAPPDDTTWRQRWALPDRWPPPVFPFQGADVVALGIPPGPRVGRILETFEAWWIAADFPKERDGLLQRLNEIAASV